MFPQHLGTYIKNELGLAPISITAGDGDDGVAQEGPAVNRLDFYSAVVGVPVTSTLAEGETATIEAEVQDSADGSTGWKDHGDAAEELVLTGDTGGSTETGIVELDVDLKAAKKYVRAVVTVTLSASETDTAGFAAIVALGGSVEKPV